MKKLQSILPAKTLTLIQSIVCLIIMLVIVFMSWGTIFTAEVSKTDKAVETFESVVNSMGGDNDVEMPGTVEISAPYVVKSVGSLGDVLKSVMNTAKNISEVNKSYNSGNDIDPDKLQSDMDKFEDNANELSESLQSDEFVGFVTLIVAVVSAFSESFLLGIVYLALIVMAIILPILATIRFLIALVSFIKHISAPEISFSTIVKGYGAVFSMFPLLWLMKIIAPAVEFSSGVTVMVALLIVGLALNLVASRLKAYTPSQFKYINLLQGMSAIGIVGYFIFMLNISGMDLFGHIWDALPAFVKSAEFSEYALPYIMIMIMVVLMISATSYVANIACRLACMVPAPKVVAGRPVQFAKDTYIASAAMSLGLIIAPIVLMVTKFSLDLGDDMASFVIFSIGIIIMFVAEILMATLKKMLCSDTTAEDVHAVLTGCPTGDVSEAPAAQEAAATEATAQEAVAEETVEIVTDEAVEEQAETVENTAESEEKSEDQV